MSDTYGQVRKKIFMLPTGRELVMTQRPDVMDGQALDEFVEMMNPGIRFQFTDDMLRKNVVPTVPWHWYPWVPTKNISSECFWSFLQIAFNFDTTAPISKSMWFHCDSSTMRAPTHLGLFLYCVYPDHIETVLEDISKDYYEETHIGHPWYYFHVELKRNKAVREICEAWRKNGPIDAYEVFMGREDILDSI